MSDLVPVPALTLNGSVTLDKLLIFVCKNRDDNIIYLIEVWKIKRANVWKDLAVFGV